MSPLDLQQIAALLQAPQWLPPNQLAKQLHLQCFAKQCPNPSATMVPIIPANPNRVLLWVLSWNNQLVPGPIVALCGPIGVNPDFNYWANNYQTGQTLFTTCWHGILPQLDWWTSGFSPGVYVVWLELIWVPPEA